MLTLFKEGILFSFSRLIGFDHVLLSIEEYQKITDKKDSIVELLVMPEVANIKFDPPQLNNNLYKPADFS